MLILARSRSNNTAISGAGCVRTNAADRGTVQLTWSRPSLGRLRSWGGGSLSIALAGRAIDCGP
jgi:hypothetical protein